MHLWDASLPNIVIVGLNILTLISTTTTERHLSSPFLSLLFLFSSFRSSLNCSSFSCSRSIWKANVTHNLTFITDTTFDFFYSARFRLLLFFFFFLPPLTPVSQLVLRINNNQEVRKLFFECASLFFILFHIFAVYLSITFSSISAKSLQMWRCPAKVKLLDLTHSSHSQTSKTIWYLHFLLRHR